MWLQRVLFNLQTRLLGRDDARLSENHDIIQVQTRKEVERARLLRTRLEHLDKRLAQLR